MYTTNMEEVDATLAKLNMIYDLEQDAFDEVARLVIYYYKIANADPNKFLELTRDVTKRYSGLKDRESVHNIRNQIANGGYSV